MPTEKRDRGPQAGAETTPESEWSIRIAGDVSWARILVVGTWLVVAASLLIWAEGPFWYDGVTWFRQAQEAAARGDWTEALANVERAREAEPEHGGLATFEGHARLGLGDPVGAAEAFREARVLAPGDVEPLLGLAEAHLESGDTARAHRALETAAPISASGSDRVRLAGLAEAAGDPALALDILVEPPPSGTLSDRIRLALQLERWPLAVELLQEAVASDAGAGGAGAASSRAVERRRQLARALRGAGRNAEALEEYRALEAEDGLDVDAAVQYAWLLNESGRHREALAVVEEAGGGEALDGREEGRAVADAVLRPELTELHIRTALWAGRIDEAEGVLADALAARPGDRELLELREEVAVARDAARARLAEARAEARARAAEEARRRAEEEARRRAEEAARTRIARDTPPDEPEEALGYWSRRLEASPSDSVARREAVALLESFQRFEEAASTLLAGREPGAVTDAETLLHLARLFEWGDSAQGVILWLERYEEVHGSVPAPSRLMAARAYMTVDRRESAHGAYQAYLASRPTDLPVRLEFARFLAASGELEAAREEYRRYRAGEGSEPVALEVARLELGLERYGAAVDAAREAVREESRETPPGQDPEPGRTAASGEDVLEARLTLVEALWYDGQRSEAERVLDKTSLDPADVVTRARVARLRGRPLEAMRLLEEAPTPEALLLRARAAMDAGHWSRAHRALDEAESADAPSRELEAARERLRRGTAPSIGLLASGGSDDVGFDQIQGGAAADRWVSGDRVRLGSAVETAFLSQGAARRELVTVTVGGDGLVVGGSTHLQGDLGLQMAGSDETTLTGGIGALRGFEDGSRLGLELDRFPVWDEGRGLEPLRYSRVRELGALGVDLMGTDLSLGGRKALGIGRAALLDLGRTWYSDGNRRSFLYGHVELPMVTRVGRWVGLQPNAYVEWFEEQRSEYASPSRYLAAGVRALAIWERDAGALRLEANPHFFDYPGESGLGLDAEIEVTRELGPVDVMLQGFYSGQGSVYGQYGVSLGVRLGSPGGLGGFGGFGASGGPAGGP